MELERLAKAKRIAELLRERESLQNRLQAVNDELKDLKLSAEQLTTEKQLYDDVRALLA